MNPWITRPQADEYAPYYAPYISQLGEGDLLAMLNRQEEETVKFLGELPEERLRHRYAPGKWSVKEVLGHVMDGERMFAYRALRIARGDTTPLPGYDENTFIQHSDFDTRPIADLLAEYRSVREATLTLFRPMTETMLARRGTANDKTATPRALAWIIAGHEAHHLDVVRTRYL